MPNLVAYDLAGVQPMSGPTGLIFAMRSRYTSQGGTEALFDEAATEFSGARGSLTATGIGTTNPTGSNPSLLNTTGQTAYTTGAGMQTGDAEVLGESGGTDFNEMAF